MIRVKIAAIGRGLAVSSVKQNFGEDEWSKFSPGNQRALIDRESARLFDIAKKAASLALKNELASVAVTTEAGKATNPNAMETCNAKYND